jgi:creatinine amidohydrolase
MTILGDETWQEAEAEHAVLLLPVGSCEQHGPHLPLDTDTRVAVALATRAAARITGQRPARAVAVAPPLAYGASGEHAAFPGTLSIGLAAVEEVLVELVRSADHFAGVVLVNAHGGNTVAVDAAVARLKAESRRVVGWAPSMPGDAHAGRTETSIMLAIAPGLVHVERAEAGSTEALGSIMPALRADGVAAVSRNGVLGNPAGASRVEGEQLIDRAVDDLVRLVTALADELG